jgi:hypothetical protein
MAREEGVGEGEIRARRTADDHRIAVEDAIEGLTVRWLDS